MFDAAALVLRPASGHVRAMTASGPPRAIKTPCVQVCVVDPASGLCLGCFRTLQEIAAWARLGEHERDGVMAELPARRARIAPEKLGPA